VLGRSDTTSASDHPLSSFTTLRSFRLCEESVYWLSRHPSFSFFKEFEVFIRRHNLASSSAELPLLPWVCRLSRVFPRTTPSSVTRGDFSPRICRRLPLLSFLLFSTYQFWKIRPGFFPFVGRGQIPTSPLPSLGFPFTLVTVFPFQNLRRSCFIPTSAHEVFTSAFQSRGESRSILSYQPLLPCYWIVSRGCNERTHHKHESNR